MWCKKCEKEVSYSINLDTIRLIEKVNAIRKK